MSHRAAREACRRTGVADTLAGSPIGHALPAAPRLAPPRGRPQADNACARHRQIPQIGGASDPGPHPPRGSAKGSPCPGAGGTVLLLHSLFGEVCAKGRRGRPRGKPGFRLGSPAPGSCWLPLRRHPPGGARASARGAFWSAAQRARAAPIATSRLRTPAAMGTASPAPGRSIRPAAVPDRLDIL